MITVHSTELWHVTLRTRWAQQTSQEKMKNTNAFPLPFTRTDEGSSKDTLNWQPGKT